MKLVAQMDEISTINIETDSTFAVLLEAQKRGHEIFYYTPNELSFEVANQKLLAPIKKIRLQKIKNNFYEILETREEDLTKVDVILVRQDPPFDMKYITSTYLLEKIKDRTVILNDPSEIRNCPEKVFVTDFPDLTVETLISSNLEKIKEFRQKHKRIILKPLYAHGGDGVMLLENDDPNIGSIFETLMRSYGAPLVAQRFLPEVKDGDKRIILINGKAVGGIKRLAKSGEIRSNLHVGGDAAKLVLSKREKEICEKIGPELKKRGLFFVGIDVIGDYLTEINVTSPTCIPEINSFDGGNIEGIIVSEIEKMI